MAADEKGPLMAAETETLPAPGRGRIAAPPEVWARVRDDYLAGMSGTDAARRHGVPLSALRRRAAGEGWRRLDQPWTPPNRLDPFDEGLELEDRVEGDLDRIEMRELSFVAHRRMMRDVLRGDAAGALRWRRVRDAMDEEEAEVERATAQADALCVARAGHAGPDAPAAAECDSRDSSDSILDGAT